MRSLVKTLTVLTLVCGAAGPLVADELPAHPDEITFPLLEFQPPEPTEFRHVLSNGVVVYLAPSNELPLIDLDVRCFGGQYLDPVGEEGLYGAMGAMLRRGGTTTMSPTEFDDRVDFLASRINAGTGQYYFSAGLNSLKSNFDESSQLFFDMLRNPGFDAARFAIYKSEALEGMKQRNDDAGDILGREWSALMYGRDHFKGRVMTQKSLEAITRERLQAAHRNIVHPGGMYIGVSGDFEEQAMLARLEELMKGWEAGERPPAPADTAHQVIPGVYHVEKDIPQGKVYIGARGIRFDDPDAIALQVMDHILGASGFTSRITRRVRSDEGLAYSAGSRMTPGLYFPGEFRALFQSKNATVALAAKLIYEELARIRTEPVTQEELEVAKNALIESFPAQFGSRSQQVGMFVTEEMRGRDWEYFRKYRDRVQSLTAEDVMQAAQEHLKPDNMAIMVVGPWAEIEAGDLEGRATMAEFFEGKVEHLPLRDPLTQEPIEVN